MAGEPKTLEFLRETSAPSTSRVGSHGAKGPHSAVSLASSADSSVVGLRADVGGLLSVQS